MATYFPRGAFNEHTARMLARAFGHKHIEHSSLRAIIAVIERCASPQTYPRDEDAWLRHAVPARSFSRWKKNLATD